MSPDLALALSFADAADAISLGRFGASDLLVETKPDRTPVTEADRAVEESIRQRVASERPGDGMLGEEFGVTGGANRRWIVDPIDGTRNYSRGIPIWATLIALEEDGAIRLGVVSAPALGRRWWAERGAGAFANGDPIHVSGVARVEDAVLCFSLERPLPPIALRCWHPRAFGDFWAHMLVAEGAVDGAIDAVGVKIWDLAALQPIVEEAGGRFSAEDGTARVDGLTAISSNGLLHEALLEASAS
jgi:histidinol-phosphatase